MLKNCWKCPVEICPDLFSEESDVLAETLRKITGKERPRILLVADSNVVQRTEGLGSKIGRYVNARNIELAGSPVVLSGGEKIKADRLASVSRVMAALLGSRLGKGDCVVALGGGTLLDVAGYAAAQVRGGIDLLRVPTTVCSMLTAPLATHAALDGEGVKDSLVVPSVSAGVLIDTGFAPTVLDGVWRAGFGEAVRGALVSDSSLLKRLDAVGEAYRNRDKEALETLVSLTLESRRKKGGTDFAEWAAARLETMSEFKLPHGYAVPISICLCCDYSVRKGLMKAADRDFVYGLLRRTGALDGLFHSAYLLARAENVLLGLDAWRLATGSEAILLPTGLGKATVDEAPDRGLITEVLREMLSRSQTSQNMVEYAS